MHSFEHAGRAKFILGKKCKEEGEGETKKKGKSGTVLSSDDYEGIFQQVGCLEKQIPAR